MKSSDKNNTVFEEQNLFSIENDEFNFNDLFQGIIRRKKFVFTTTIAIFLVSLIFTIFQRIFNPHYKGSFSMLTDDPMLDSQDKPTKRSDANINALQYTQYENIALNKSSYDTDTLIELLKSPLYLNKVEKNLGLPISTISKMISISPPKSNFSAEGM